MADALELVHVSGGLLSPAIIADALSDAPKRKEFQPLSFAYPGHDAESPTLFTETVETSFKLACEQYDSIARDLDNLSVSDLREKWLRPLFGLLDFDLQFQRGKLKSSDGRDSFDISFLGWNDLDVAPIHLIKGELDEAPGRDRRSAHDELQVFLNRSEFHPWGIVANGRRVRLLRDFHHSYTKAFVGFDIDAIFESRDFISFRALYRFCHRSRLDAPAGKPPLLEALFETSQAEGIQIGRQLQPQVRAAIELLAEGLFSQELRDLLQNPKEARALYRELLIVIYRLLFLLFAEQRKMLPPEGIYAETYSLAALARFAEQSSTEPHRRDLWEGLKVTFEMLSKGAPDIGVFPFNGQLFDLRRTARLMTQSCENKALLKAIHALTHVDVGGLRQRVNYAELGVEELGSVYQTLLGYAPRVSAGDLVDAQGRLIPRGNIGLASLTTERSDLGVHYTRPPLVDFLLSVSLDRLIKERLDAAKDKPAKIRALLNIRACDSAAGSGAILVGAIDRLALALATVRADGQKPAESALQEARREVLAHCIYGVDKDDFAVELCKVALWIHCAVPSLPLSFLDHRIQHGDSLVGWPLLNVPSAIPADAYSVPGNLGRDDDSKRLRTFLQNAREANQLAVQGQGELGQLPPKPDIRVDFPAVMAEEERIPGDVERKDTAFKGYLESDSYRRFKAAADLWTAAFFWSHEVGSAAPTTEHYRRAMTGKFDEKQVQAAQELLEEFPAFHWPLQFPEIAARGGFDCFVGNPPWEKVENTEQDWFAVRAPEIAALKGAERKAAIESARTKEPELWRHWRIYERLNQRMAEFARNCGRYSSEGGKANTYLMFTDLVADALRSDGRAGIIVKTALATDKTATAVFHRLLKADQIEDFHDHVNGGPTGTTMIFSDVDAKERFVVLGVRGPRDSGAQPLGFEATLMNWSIDEARNRPRQHFTTEVLNTLNPNTGTLTSFRRGDELDVALDIHRRATKGGSQIALLDFEEGGSNPWGLKFLTLFNATTASVLFLRRENLESDGWALGKDMVFRRKLSESQQAQDGLLKFDVKKSFEEAFPLYEGQLSNRYDHRARTYTGYGGPSKYGTAPGAPETTDAAKANPDFEIEPRYWMLAEAANDRLRIIGDRACIGFRDIGAAWRNQRSARAALVPRYPATNLLPLLSVSPERSFEFLGVFNSAACDFLLRGHMPGAHANRWIVAQIAAPLPGTLDKRVAEHAAKLSLTSHSVARLFTREPHIWNPEERAEMDVEIDALVAHAYGLTRAQYEVVLDSFEVLARIEIAKHGRYKFKEDCLAAYARVA